MNKQAEEPQLSSLAHVLLDLANEVDGVVDFGIPVCLIEAERMAGRHQYIVQRCQKIRLLVDSMTGLIKKSSLASREQASIWQAELVAGSVLLLDAFMSLENFPGVSREILRSKTDSLRAGWETIHKSLREMADALGLLHESRYAPILERQSRYRNRLDQAAHWFHEALGSK